MSRCCADGSAGLPAAGGAGSSRPLLAGGHRVLCTDLRRNLRGAKMCRDLWFYLGKWDSGEPDLHDFARTLPASHWSIDGVEAANP